MPGLSDTAEQEALRNKIIGLGEKSIRKSYYPELQQRIAELETANTRLTLEIRGRMHTEEMLRETEQKYRTLFSAMNETVVMHELILDGEGVPVDYRIVDCNEAFTRISGIPREQALGTSGSRLFGMSPPPYLALYADVALTGNSCSYTDRYSVPDRYFSVSVICPCKGQFATITSDITDIMQMKEALLAKNRELEKYLYIASHDLRSPLVNIQGFSTRLKKQTAMIRDELDLHTVEGDVRSRLDAALSSEIPRSLDFIFTNVDKMDRLISGLLQISRTGRLALSVRRLDMNALIGAVLDSLAYETEQAQATVTVGVLEPCFGDDHLLNQLFTNIIGNALKYRDRGRQLYLDISCKPGKRKNLYSIRDTGQGIDARHLERIWDVFYRADWVNGPPGEGIGLSLVKRIAEKHKGRVTVESVKGEGSVFTVELLSEMFVEEE